MNFGQYKVLSIDALKPYERNARTHSPEQVAQLVASMEQFGFTNPLLIDDEFRIIAGHGRMEAAKVLRMGEVPCIVLSGLTDEQRRALVLADNQLALNAGWDLELLKGELGDLQTAGFDIGVIGFDADFLNGLFDLEPEGKTDPDAVPGVPDEPVSKPGDVWVLGPHRVMCGDSTSITDVERLMGGALADCCWTDPPYNVAYESKLAGKIKNDDMADSEFRDFLLAAYGCMFVAMKPGAPIYVAHADTEGYNFLSAFKQAGFKLSGCLIWRKDSLVLGRKDYQRIHEPILYGWKEGSKHRWYGGRKQTTMIDLGENSPFKRLEDGRYSIQIGDRLMIIDGSAAIEELVPSVINEPKPKKSAEHPTMKPVALIERMLKHSARKGDLILDLFGGSGSTMMAAERLGMSSCLMELDPKFVDVIVKRWEDYTGRKAQREGVSDGN